MMIGIICCTLETRSKIMANEVGTIRSRDTELNVYIEIKTRISHPLLLSSPLQHIEKLLINVVLLASSDVTL